MLTRELLLQHKRSIKLKHDMQCFLTIPSKMFENKFRIGGDVYTYKTRLH